MNRPTTDEYAPFYAHYVSLVGDGDVVTLLESQIKETVALLRKIPEEKGAYRYAEGKWSIKEVVGHLIDAERIFTARALRFARGDATALPGFEQNDYVETAGSDRYPLAELADEFEAVRRSTCLMFRHMADEATLRRGTASGNGISVRALAYITAGHELHHRGVIAEKYLSAPTA